MVKILPLFLILLLAFDKSFAQKIPTKFLGWWDKKGIENFCKWDSPTRRRINPDGIQIRHKYFLFTTIVNVDESNIIVSVKQSGDCGSPNIFFEMERGGYRNIFVIDDRFDSYELKKCPRPK